MRICSLLPSATEIVGALGLADQLVGVSAECDHPPQVRGLPVVTGSRIELASLPSASIDAAVRDALLESGSLYAIDEERLRELRPDLVITQDLCAVCAVGSGDVLAIHALDAEVVSLDPRSIVGIEQTVQTLAERLGVPERGQAVVAEMRGEIERVRAAVAKAEPRRVFVAEWLDPPFAAGHWVPEMVAAAGGEEVLGRAGEPSFRTTWEAVRDAAPELVVAAPCGFDARRAAEEAALPDVGCPVVAVDANAYFSRPAPRIAGGIAQLGHLLHPDLVPDPGVPAIALALRSA